MKVVFWLSVFAIVFSYIGYPFWIWSLAHLRPLPINRKTISPTVSIILAVYNEERNLPRKLGNLESLNYPQECVEIIVVSDGSCDRTNSILAKWPYRHKSILLGERVGKANALNNAIAMATGEIVCFTDARQLIASEALRTLVSNFADDRVGCVSGQLIISNSRGVALGSGMGLYWRFEKKIRYWEGLSGSSVGATGALYAVRKNLLTSLPLETILDDVYIPLEVVRRGLRAIFEPRAIAWDDFEPTGKQEFQRKVRTLFGTLQLLQLAPWILKKESPIRVRFICHKLLRLLVPFVLLSLFIASMCLRGKVYSLVLVGQLVFYLVAAVSIVVRPRMLTSRLASVICAFIVVNAAAVVACVYFVVGRKAVWVHD